MDIMAVGRYCCEKCNKFFDRPPLSGKCECGGGIVFKHNEKKSAKQSQQQVVKGCFSETTNMYFNLKRCLNEKKNGSN